MKDRNSESNMIVEDQITIHREIKDFASNWTQGCPSNFLPQNRCGGDASVEKKV